MLVVISDSENNFVCQDVHKLVREILISKSQKRQARCYSMRRRELEIKVGVLLEEHWLSSRRQNRVEKFGWKFIGSFKVLDVVNNNIGIRERKTVNFDQVRVYKFRNDSVPSQMSGGDSQLPR